MHTCILKNKKNTIYLYDNMLYIKNTLWVVFVNFLNPEKLYIIVGLMRRQSEVQNSGNRGTLNFRQNSEKNPDEIEKFITWSNLDLFNSLFLQTSSFY